MKKLFLIISIILLNINISGCSDITDQIANYVDKDNQYVLSIKSTVPPGETKTFGQAFDNFFQYPTWKYFDATTGESVVEFTGYCTYMDNQVKATLQFVLDKNSAEYEIRTLAFNDISQNQLILQALILKIFE